MSMLWWFDVDLGLEGWLFVRFVLLVLVFWIFMCLANFSIGKHVCMGSGVGATGLLAYALEHPESVSALILFGCVASPSSWSVWASNRISQTACAGTELSITDKLLKQWFSPSFIQDPESGVVPFYTEELKNLIPTNVGKYYAAKNGKPDLLARLPDLKDIDTLQFIGDAAEEADLQEEVSTALPKCETIEIRGVKDLLFVERPWEVIQEIDLFLAPQGY